MHTVTDVRTEAGRCCLQGKLKTHVATLQEHFKEEEDLVPQLRATFPYQEYHAVSRLRFLPLFRQVRLC